MTKIVIKKCLIATDGDKNEEYIIYSNDKCTESDDNRVTELDTKLTTQCQQNQVNAEMMTIASYDFAKMAVYVPEAWLQLIGALVSHKYYGVGKVVSAYPYFIVQFGDKVSKFTTHAFGLEIITSISVITTRHTRLNPIPVISEITISKKIISKINEMYTLKKKIKEASKKKEDELTHWYETLKSLTEFEYPQHEWQADTVYSDLTDSDRKLAQSWLDESDRSEWSLARMLSARAAEKVARYFYLGLGLNVEDTSIEQLQKSIGFHEESSENWKLFDLLLDDTVGIDVKNARNPLNSQVSYVEHCVSRFKKDRDAQHIIIFGVLSPYLRLDDIQAPHRIGYGATVKCLGETTFSEIYNLERRFCKGVLTVTLDRKNFLPRWLFDYSDIFYENRNALRSKILQWKTKEIPTLLQCKQHMVNPLPAYLLSGIALPKIWEPFLLDWQVNFYNRIKGTGEYTVKLPVLFLALLTHFLESMTNSRKCEDYNPDKYRELLYVKSSHNPIGIFDPLGVIDSLITTLVILWENRHHTNLGKFVQFKFNGLGLLEGRRNELDKFETILAYCGGFVEGKGKCGNIPLILGKHENCQECGKLICELCGHCNTECPSCVSRMKNHN